MASSVRDVIKKNVAGAMKDIDTAGSKLSYVKSLYDNAQAEGKGDYDVYSKAVEGLLENILSIYRLAEEFNNIV